LSKHLKIAVDAECGRRLLKNLKVIDSALANGGPKDRVSVQVALEVRWLLMAVDLGEITLPDWELALIQAARNKVLLRYPEIDAALKEAAADLAALKRLANGSN